MNRNKMLLHAPASLMMKKAAVNRNRFSGIMPQNREKVHPVHPYFNGKNTVFFSFFSGEWDDFMI